MMLELSLLIFTTALCIGVMSLAVMFWGVRFSHTGSHELATVAILLAIYFILCGIFAAAMSIALTFNQLFQGVLS